MKLHTVCLVAGTRPEVIKLAPVYLELLRSKALSPFWLSTGQHREMLDQAMSDFGISADEDLHLMKKDQHLGELNARTLSEVGKCFRRLRPDAVLVQGDTTTVLAAAMAAFYERIPVGHVEAGLRTHNLLSPWPEEMNRRLAAPLAQWCFCPTHLSRDNLIAEAVSPDVCHVTGNTIVDALLWMCERAEHRGGARDAAWAGRMGVPPEFASRFLLSAGARWILVTGHRRESFGSGLEDICNAIRQIAESYPDCGVLYPVHLNPNVQGPVRAILGGIPSVALIDPVGYGDFVELMRRCYFLLSDSGGVQEEAPTLGKPLLVTRPTTERPEGISAGTCRLVGTDPSTIVREASLLLCDGREYQRRSELQNPYGDGKASQRIRSMLETHFAA